MMRGALIVVGCVALASCATPETRLRTGLYNAGLSKPMSACLSERMVDRLSLMQLRKLSALESVRGKRVADMSMDQFLHRVRALKDGEILGVATSSAAICAVQQL